MQSPLSVIINPPAEKAVAFGWCGFVSQRPIFVKFATDPIEFFDGLPRHLVGFGCLAGCDSLLPKHVTARFGGHAPSQVQLALEQKARVGCWMSAIQDSALVFDFFESRFKILSSDPGVNFQTIFAPDLAVGRWWRGQRSSERRAVKCSIAEQPVSKTEAPCRA